MPWSIEPTFKKSIVEICVWHKSNANGKVMVFLEETTYRGGIAIVEIDPRKAHDLENNEELPDPLGVTECHLIDHAFHDGETFLKCEHLPTKEVKLLHSGGSPEDYGWKSKDWTVEFHGGVVIKKTQKRHV